MQDKQFSTNPLLVGLLAVPLLIHYAIMIAWTYPLGYFLGWKYESAIDTTIIGSSSHFEVAIAVAVTLYGIGSRCSFSYSHRSTFGSAAYANVGKAWIAHTKILPSKEQNSMILTIVCKRTFRNYSYFSYF